MEKNQFHKYIAIEGPIGVGKSSMVTLLAQRLGIDPIFEKVAENPFLGKFYQDQETYAFQTQIFFLMSRFKQLSPLSQIDLFNQATLCDYLFERDLVFAGLNLSESEFSLYLELFTLLTGRLTTPDLTIYLQADTDTLMRRIAKRNRPIEKGVSEDYIDQVHRAFNHFFFNDYKAGPLLIINTNHIDFVENGDDFEPLIKKIGSDIKGVEFFNPERSVF